MSVKSFLVTAGRRAGKLRALAATSAAAALLAAGLVTIPGAASATGCGRFPFRDPRLPLGQRIADLLGRLTTQQKLSLLFQYQPAIPAPLCLPAMKNGTEALHGIAWSNDINNNGNVVYADGTTFPQAIGMASTWDPALLTMADINRAGSDVLSIRFRLGDFDPSGLDPYSKITPAVIDDAAHRALSRRTADESMVLLKNSGNTLPLNPATTRKIAVVGPLSDTLYSDWYGSNLPYQVTPLEGITQAVGPGATVTTSEGVNRIALKDVATGKYVTAGSGANGAKLAETATSPDPTTQFDVTDWGSGVDTLRSVANGKYVNYEYSDGFVNDQTQPSGWYVTQQFKLDPQPDGTYVLQYHDQLGAAERPGGHLDDARGPGDGACPGRRAVRPLQLIATVPVTSTGGQYNWSTVTAPVTGASGIHDLYLDFTGPLEVSTFSFSR